MTTKIAVLGAGSWGTALAETFARAGHPVTIWDKVTRLIRAMAKDGENRRYHPGHPLSDSICPTTSLEEAIKEASLVFLSVPSYGIRDVLTRVKEKAPSDATFVCTAKGLELETVQPLSAVAADVLGKKRAKERYAVLSGPSFAKEVIAGQPVAVTVASGSQKTAQLVQRECHTNRFQIFSTEDVIGVEIGGALKNVIAIGAGASDALGFGHNARASLITRALAEISRIGCKLGANPLTFAGLAGLGDLLLTCTGDLSRNRQVGLKFAQGKTIHQIMREIGQVAEGIRTTKAAYRMAQSLKVEIPIIEAMYHALYDHKDPRRAVEAILSLPPAPNAIRQSIKARTSRKR